MTVWTQTARDIVDDIDNETGVDWDSECVTILLAGYIENNCKQEDFEKYVKMVAADDIKEMQSAQKQIEMLEDE